MLSLSSTISDQSSSLYALVALSNTVRAFGVPNFLGAKRPVHSEHYPVRPVHLEHYQDQAIIDFLCCGWSINYQSVLASTFGNHPSAIKNSDYLTTYISKELAYQAVFGPFRRNPFSMNCVVSPLLFVPECDSVKLHIVHNLSFPERFSVNDGIRKDYFLLDFLGSSMRKVVDVTLSKRISHMLFNRFPLTQQTTLRD